MIYEAALVPEKWSGVLDALSQRIGAVGGVTFVVEPEVTRWTASPAMMETMAAFIDEGWIGRNSRFRNGVALCLVGQHCFYTDEQLYPDGSNLTDPLYTEFMVPRGLGLCVGSALPLPHGDQLVISFERDARLGTFAEDSITLLNGLYGDIHRAAMIAGRLAFERVRGAVDALDRLGLPSLAVDSSGRVLTVGAHWDAHAGLWDTGARDRLVLTDPRARMQLREALASLAVEPHARTLALTDAGGLKRAVLHVLPIRRAARDIYSGGAAVLTLSLPREGMLAAAPLVQALLDLTPTEADIAVRLANGLNPKEIARQTGKSVETVRTQVKAVLRKTGCQRTGQLIVLLGDLAPPAPMQAIASPPQTA
jgi:DNA-binding CsgD family transcriptional regulator